MNVAKRDYYEVLGVGRDSDEQALKSAYRKLALQHHPDRNPNNPAAEEKFKEAAEAYSVLSDSQKRASYDRFGHAGVQNQGGGSPFDGQPFPDLEDLMSAFGFDMFGGAGGQRRSRNRVQRGEDVRFDLEITFEEAMRGMSAEIQVPRHEQCTRCSGQGAEPEDGLITCSICKGRGEIAYQQGFLSVRRTCNQCGGRGKIIRRPCTMCKGEGHTRSERKLKINIPAGVDSGTRLRLQSEGQPGGQGGPPGDLYVILKVKEHPIFERQDSDLHCSIPINIAQAVLGTSIDLLTFDGLQAIRIPEGTQNGAILRLKNLGVPHLNGSGRGDLYIHIVVRVPSKINRDQRKLFEQLRELLPVENEPQEHGLFDRVKDYFRN
ncbi:MAG: molecular chaperone DnaJ [Bryobacteraceae bacterium]